MDRNADRVAPTDVTAGSLSARRAWIEICETTELQPVVVVALRKESVDRNQLHRDQPGKFPRSLSARRAWIEMCFTAAHLPGW